MYILKKNVRIIEFDNDCVTACEILVFKVIIIIIKPYKLEPLK